MPADAPRDQRILQVIDHERPDHGLDLLHETSPMPGASPFGRILSRGDPMQSNLPARDKLASESLAYRSDSRDNLRHDGHRWGVLAPRVQLWSIERTSHIMALVTDEGLAMFAGLNAIPKRSCLAEYSSRIDHAMTTKLLAAWQTPAGAAGLWPRRSVSQRLAGGGHRDEGMTAPHVGLSGGGT